MSKKQVLLLGATMLVSPMMGSASAQDSGRYVQVAEIEIDPAQLAHAAEVGAAGRLHQAAAAVFEAVTRFLVAEFPGLGGIAEAINTLGDPVLVKGKTLRQFARASGAPEHGRSSNLIFIRPRTKARIIYRGKFLRSIGVLRWASTIGCS